MVRKVIIAVFALLLLSVIGLFGYFYFQAGNRRDFGARGCEVFIEDQSNELNISVINRSLWEEISSGILPCDNGVMSIFSPQGGNTVKISRLTIVLSEEEYRAKKVWGDTETYLYNDYSFSENGKMMYYYISPREYDSTYPEDLSLRVSKFVNYVLVSLTLDDRDTKSRQYESWDTSRKTLTDMGLKLEVVE